MAKKILIFGAGKIGRGFIGHLFHRSGYALTFTDPVQSVVQSLNKEGGYPLLVLGAPEKNAAIPVAQAIWSSSEKEVLAAIRGHDLFATAVGGPNLGGVGRLLAAGLRERFAGGNRTVANVIICENYKDPARILREAILANAPDAEFRAWVETSLGIAETQVLRSCIEPDPATKARQPLAVQVQDWWVLPCDRDAFKGAAPECEGLSLRGNFQNELIRKVYTYNCSNATIAYLGHLRGYKMLYEAANDPEILEITRRVYEESGRGLTAEYHFDPKEQADLQNLALTKYQDRKILDPIERNARDTQRKLSPTDRLLGPANLAVKHGGTPVNLGIALAAGLHYNGSDDPGTRHVQQVLRTEGLRAAIQDVCKLSPDSTMGRLICAGVHELPRFNRIGIPLQTGQRGDSV